MNDRIQTIGSFVGFGLINNLLYVVILSAAIDLIGPKAPKGVVLLADVLPSLLFKLSAPFYFHIVKYPIRIMLMIMLSFTGMMSIALSSLIAIKLVGIVLASLASGMGEVTFLQLTHYYDESAVHAWSSGTGAAGLVGSFVFLVMTTWLQVSTRTTLIVFSFIPFGIGIIYYSGLPESNRNRLNQSWGENSDYEQINNSETSLSTGTSDDSTIMVENTGVSSAQMKVNLLRRLAIPYILPLMVVYVAEYVINQGISPTLLFDLPDMPNFHTYRDAYVTYGALYQLGVFISRSSGTLVKIRKLWGLAILQTINVGLALIQSVYMINPSIYVNFVFMFYEGLLGGAAYVNTFANISSSVSLQYREFAMGAVTMSDSSGVVIAALVSIWLEPTLCQYQINDGRPWCHL